MKPRTASAPKPAKNPEPGIKATPIAFVQCLVLAYTRRKLNPQAMLDKAHIAPAMLQDAKAHITALQFETATETAMRELDDEALGWFERRLPWGSYGLLVRASLTAPTLGVALKRWCRHHHLLTNSIRLDVTEQQGHASITVTEQTDLGAMREFCIVSVLRNVLGVACWLCDSGIALAASTFRFAPPPHADSYRVLFDGPCQFQSASNTLQFDARYLQLPLRRDEAAMRRLLQRALPLTVRPYRRDRLLVEKVRQALAQYPAQTRNAQSLAARLNLSERSLHRQLKQEGSSLQHIKNTVRRDLALNLLQRSNKPQKQIAEAVGFKNEKSFIRAFKAWTGSNPDALRNKAP
ncbi:MAG: AraC family transcriptional regulator [Rhodoferax sp.]|nr:AraC family transcriptional regulator [Rhodoferax sp.]